MALHFGLAGFGGVFASVRWLGIDRLFERSIPVGDPIAIDIVAPTMEQIDDGVIDPGGPTPSLAAAMMSPRVEAQKGAAAPASRQARRPLPGRVRRSGPEPSKAAAVTSGLPDRKSEAPDEQAPPVGEPLDRLSDPFQGGDDGDDKLAGGRQDSVGGSGTPKPAAMASVTVKAPPKPTLTAGIGGKLGPGTNGSGDRMGTRPSGRSREGFRRIASDAAQYLRTYDSYPDLPPVLARPGPIYEFAIEVCIAETGLVEEVKLVKSGASQLDQPLLSKVRTWRYNPYKVNGEAVPFCHPMKVQFQYSQR